MAIKIPEKRPAAPKSPEELFHSLRSRSPEIKSLWSQQADVLRDYAKHIDTKNVAFALPTGAGKTLVTLLISEFRRLARGERVAYLCPTRQLARQVGLQAEQYGIPATVLVGPQRDYSPAEFGAFSTATKIAITTYSGIFNTNPRINNAQFVVCDDAHAAENYVAGFWSLCIDRREHEELYGAVLDVVASGLPDSFVSGMRSDNPTPSERDSVGMVLQPLLLQRLEELSAAIAERVGDGALKHPWSLLRERLNACNVFIARHQILVRPLSPPTLTHMPFANAKQRLYVSATLGSPGELERMTGIHPMTRLATPTGWENRTPGRRFVLIPNLSLDEADSDSVAANAANMVPRTLILSPDHRRSERLARSLKSNGLSRKVFAAGDIDSGLDEFVNDEAVLMLSGRYEGIDLPDDSCRLLIVDGSPDAVTLQERFLSQRLGATAVLRDRFATRIAQALGRCTRNDRDFAAVLLVGTRLAHRIVEEEVKALLPAELRAELAIGITNSADATTTQLVDLVSEFLTNEATRSKLDEYVAEQRESFITPKSSVAAVLEATADDEIVYAKALWENNWRKAYSAAHKVAEKLSGGDELKPYRAFWLYLAGSAAQGLARIESDTELRNQAAKLLSSAYEVSSGISWFASALKEMAVDTQTVRNATDEALAESVARLLVGFGNGTRFERHLAEVEKLLADVAAKRFHLGLEQLGHLLGFEATRPNESLQGAPDVFWRCSDYVVVFEAKSDVDPDKQVSISDAREAGGHAKWIRAQLGLPESTQVIVAVATYQTKIDPNAKVHLDGIRILPIGNLHAFARGLFNALRAARRDAGRLGEPALAARLQKELRQAGAQPSMLIQTLLPGGTQK